MFFFFFLQVAERIIHFDGERYGYLRHQQGAQMSPLAPMSISPHSRIAVGSLLFSSLALELTSHPSQEIVTECVCWTLILLYGYMYSRHVAKSSRSFNSSQLGVIAFGITLLCLTCSLQRTISFTVSPNSTFIHTTANFYHQGSTTRTSACND